MHDTGPSLLSLPPLPVHTHTVLVVSGGLLNAHWYACGNFTVKTPPLSLFLAVFLALSVSVPLVIQL